MRIKQKITTVFMSLFALTGTMLVIPSGAVYSATCNGVETSIIDCGGSEADNKDKDIQKNAIWKLLIMALNIMTGLVGIAAVGGIVYGAILYGSAGDKAEQTKKAKEIIFNVVLGLIAYVLMYGFLNFLIPGGIFT